MDSLIMKNYYDKESEAFQAMFFAHPGLGAKVALRSRVYEVIVDTQSGVFTQINREFEKREIMEVWRC